MRSFQSTRSRAASLKTRHSLGSGVVLVMCAALAQPAGAVSILNSFDASTEGWSGNFTVSHQASGGNPSGWLKQAGNLAGAALVAPTTYHGDLTAFDGGTFSWDAISIRNVNGVQANSYTFGRLTVTGTAGVASTAVIPFTSAPVVGGGWLSFTQSFDAANFGTTQATWSAILADVTDVTFHSHIYTASDDVGFDNFQLVSSPIPLPTAGGLACAGFLILGARARRRSL